MDGAATRSLYIGLAMLLLGVLLGLTVAIQYRAGTSNLGLPMLMALIALTGSAWGTIEASRALKGQTVRRSHANIGLAINGSLIVIVVLLIAFAVLVGSAMTAMNH